MLDDITLNVSYLAGFLVIISLFRYFTLKGDPMVSVLPFLFTLFLNDVMRFQLDAIPTVGFSDPILSYLSAIRFLFDCDRMLKDGYRKVILPLTICRPFSDQTDDAPTFRQDQVYSRSPTFGDGWCMLPDLS